MAISLRSGSSITWVLCVFRNMFLLPNTAGWRNLSSVFCQMQFYFSVPTSVVLCVHFMNLKCFFCVSWP